MISERIARYQRERERIFLRWCVCGGDREIARNAIRVLTRWIEALGVRL